MIVPPKAAPRPGSISWPWAVLAVSAVLALFYGNLLLGDGVAAGDTARLHFPARVFLLERLGAGELPLWYPYDGLGVPFVAGAVTGVFHPFTVFHLIFGPAWGLWASTLVCLLLAAAGAFELSRRAGAGPAGSFVAAVAYAAGGPVVSAIDNITYLSGIAALPWFLTGLVMFVRGGGLGGAALAGAALAFAVLAGELQSVYLLGLLAPVLALVLAGGTPGRRLGRTALLLALGAGLGAVQALPALTVAAVSGRAAGLPYALATRWSLHPRRLADLFVTDTWQYTPRLDADALGPLFDAGGLTPWTPSVFLGVVTGLGLLWCVLLEAGTPGLRKLLLVAFVVLVWAALGRYASLYYTWWAMLPGFDAFRYPLKLLPLASLLAAVAAGLGTGAALAAPARALRITLVAGAVALGLGAVLFLAPSAWARLVADDALQPLALEQSARLSRGLLGAGVLAGLLAGAFVLARVRGGVAGAALLCALHLADLTRTNGEVVTLFTADVESIDGPSAFVPVLRELAGTGTGRVRVAGLPSVNKSPLLPEVRARGGKSVLGITAFERQVLMPDHAGRFGVESPMPYLPGGEARVTEPFLSRRTTEVAEELPLFNVGYLVTDPPLFAALGPGPEVVSRLPALDLVLARLPEALPRAYLAWPRFVGDGETARHALASPAVRAGAVAVVEADGPTSAPHDAPPPGSATVVEHAPESVTIDVDAGAAGSVLVLADAFFPGWEARIDGEPAPLWRANYLVRAVPVPAGRHRVTFAYPVPTSLIAGAGVSFATLLGLMGWGWRRRRAR